MADAINFPGTVDWSGENPGISLKETPDGPFVALASFFRVVLSPHGRGHALVLMQSPQDAKRGRQRLLPRQRKARALSGQRFRLAFRRVERPAGSAGPDLPHARQRRGLGRSGEHLQRDGQGRRHDGAPHLERAGQAVLLRAAAGQVGDRQALHAEPVRRRARTRRSRSTARRCPASRCRARSPGTTSPPRCWRSRRRGSGRRALSPPKETQDDPMQRPSSRMRYCATSSAGSRS